MHQNPISAAALPQTPFIRELTTIPETSQLNLMGPSSGGKGGYCCGVQKILKIDRETVRAHDRCASGGAGAM